MLAVINFIAVFLVSAVVAYQIYENVKTQKEISQKLTKLEEEDESTKSSIYKAKKDISNDIQQTSSRINEKVDRTGQHLQQQLEGTQTFMTNELKQQQNNIQSLDNTTKTLDKYFKSLSQQVLTKNTTTDTLNLGKKWKLSGVGDAHGNDDWLRLFGSDGKGYYGGFATSKLWVGDETHINNNMNLNGTINVTKADPGAIIERNLGRANDRYGVGQYPNGAMRMYTSGLNKQATAGLSVAKTDGKLDDVLTVTSDKLTNVYGDLDLRGKLYLGRVDGRTDPYSIEKKLYAPNQSALRLTINNEADEALEIWGDSCSTGNCAGEGVLRHKFQANGDARHEGNLTVQKKLLVNRGPNDKYPAWGNGIHTWDLYANGAVGVGTNGNVSASIDNQGKVQATSLCIDNVCLNSQQLNTIKSQAKV